MPPAVLSPPPASAPDAPVSEDAPDAPSAEARLEATVRRILQADEVPAFSQAMRDVMATVGRDEASAQQLANLVLRDYALTVKVIRAANSAHHNRTGRPVQSATHALMLLGARTVRELAATVMLFEHYRRRSPGLKELMLLALLTASHARVSAEVLGGADPETAHLCGMFRSLGEVLVAAHLPDEYAAILRTAAARAADATAARGGERPRTAAALRASCATAVLGGPFEEVGAAIARHWGMPDVVRHALHATGAAGEGRVATLTAFAHALTGAVYQEDAADAPRATTTVLDTHGARLTVSRATCKQVADRAVAETRELFAAAGVRLDDLRLSRQVAAALSEAATDTSNESRMAPRPPTAEEVTTPTAGAPPAGAGETTDAAPPSTSPLADAAGTPADGGAAVSPAPAATSVAEVRARLAPELAAAAADASSYDLPRVLLMALEAVLRGGPFDRACFHAADAAAGEFRPRTGLGDGVDRLLSGPGVPFAAGQGPAGPSLLRGDEVQLAHGTRLTLGEAQLLRRWNAMSVALFPVKVDGAVIGCLHADRHTAFAAPDAAALAYVREVARALERAIVVRRQARLTAPAGVPVVPPPPAGVPARTVGPAGAPPPAAIGVQTKVDAVLRLLRGEPAAVVAASAGVTPAKLEAWRASFLAGAAARLDGAA